MEFANEAVQISGVYSLLAGISGAFIVIIVALGIALARTREQVATLSAKVERLEKYTFNGKKDG
jgi:hypothetical protein